jgi:hypothetical protein
VRFGAPEAIALKVTGDNCPAFVGASLLAIKSMPYRLQASYTIARPLQALPF